MVGGGQADRQTDAHTHHSSVILEKEGCCPTPPGTLIPALIPFFFRPQPFSSPGMPQKSQFGACSVQSIAALPQRLCQGPTCPRLIGWKPPLVPGGDFRSVPWGRRLSRR